MARERAERGGETPSNQQHTSLSIAEIRQLIRLMDKGDIEEIAIEQERDGFKLVLRKPEPTALEWGDDDVDAYAEGVEPAAGIPVETTRTLGATLVGIYHESMTSGGKSLVAAGDAVREGQVVGAIEALNVLSEVESPHAGRVREVLVTDGQPVEYGQPLMVIEL